MKKTDWNNLNEAALQTKLAELRDQVRSMRFAIANRQLKDVRDLREARLEVARVQTELSKRRNSAKA